MQIAGIDIGGTSVKVGLIDVQKGLMEKTSFPTPIGDAEKMADMIAQSIAPWDLDAVGVGTAGSVSTRTGLVRAGNLKWIDVPFRKILEEKLQLPVWVDNDAQTAMMAEVFDGTLKGVKNAVYLTFGTGIGGGLLINGAPWRGSDNRAAELGHIITHADGLPCPCTKKGCFEQYASGGALSRMAGGKSVKEIFALAADGDEAYQQLLNQYYHEISIGLASIISIFMPDVISLGGGVSEAGAPFLAGIQAAMAQQFHLRAHYFQGEIRLARHKNEAGMIGAASLALYHFFPEGEKS